MKWTVKPTIQGPFYLVKIIQSVERAAGDIVVNALQKLIENDRKKKSDVIYS